MVVEVLGVGIGEFRVQGFREGEELVRGLEDLHCCESESD